MDINHWGQLQLTKQKHSTGADVDLVLLVVDDFGIVFVTMYQIASLPVAFLITCCPFFHPNQLFHHQERKDLFSIKAPSHHGCHL